MKRLISLGMPKGARFKFSLFVAVLQGLSAIALLGVSAWLIARAAEMPSMMYLSLAIVGVRTFALARSALRYAERWLSHDSVLASASEMRGQLYSRLIPLVPGKEHFDLGELSARVINDVDELPNFSLRVLLPLVQSVSVSILSVVLFALILPIAALPLAVALAIAFVFALPLAARISAAADRGSAGDRAELITLTRTVVAGAPVIHSYGWQAELLGKVQVLQSRIASANAKTARALGLGQAAFGFMAQASSVIAAVLGLQALQASGSKSLVMLAVYALLPLGVFDVAAVAANLLSTWRRFRSSASRVLDLLDGSVDNNADAGIDAAVTRDQLPAITSLALVGASIGYETPVLSDVNISISAGKVTALVGASGDGKSTIGLALAGFITPTLGELRVNGLSSESLGLYGERGGALLRTRVGYLEQSPSILAGNVRQNLKLAAPHATDVELIAVLKRVQLWAMFAAREGLDTELGQAGVLISGGEAQRLSLARALLAKFDAIILDEPTANLSRTQALALARDILAETRRSNVATLLITHQSDLAELADESYAIE
ncbi:MAG: thiol reductant ABC exporter subunit CydC [Micrococcales bacterium]